MINKKLHSISTNKRAYNEYLIEEEFEAGIVLEGWEVKSVRLGKINITESYVILRDRSAYLLGTNFQPSCMVSTHIICNPIREKKLLLKQRELKQLYGKINRKGYTAIALSLYWKKMWCKVRIGIAKGKMQHDKRANIKNREWQIHKERLVKNQIL